MDKSFMMADASSLKC